MANTSVIRNIPELEQLREDIKACAGMKDKTLSPNDFETIANDIDNKVGPQTISAKTLRRLLGYDKTDDNSSIRLYTLDMLSKYVGYECWDAYKEHLQTMAGSGSGSFNGSTINAGDLTIGHTIQISWRPDRRSTLKYLGSHRFEIIETENSKWQVGDTFLCKHLIVGKPLYVDNLTDKDGVLKSAMYVVGEKGGIDFASEDKSL